MMARHAARASEYQAARYEAAMRGVVEVRVIAAMMLPRVAIVDAATIITR